MAGKGLGLRLPLPPSHSPVPLLSGTGAWASCRNVPASVSPHVSWAYRGIELTERGDGYTGRCTCDPGDAGWLDTGAHSSVSGTRLPTPRGGEARGSGRPSPLGSGHLPATPARSRTPCRATGAATCGCGGLGWGRRTAPRPPRDPDSGRRAASTGHRGREAIGHVVG